MAREKLAAAAARPMSERLILALSAILGREIVFTDPIPKMGAGGLPYKGAETHGLTPFFNSRTLHPDDEGRLSLRVLRARAGDLIRNTGHGRRFINMLRTHVVGPEGFACVPKVRGTDGALARDLNRRIADSWYEFSEGPVTADGRWNATDLQYQLIAAWAEAGEIFFRRWFDYPNDWGIALEPIDAALVDESYSTEPGKGRNEIRLGIEVDGFGRPQVYHVLETLRATGTARNRLAYPAREVTQWFIPDRVNQARGVTPFAPVLVDSGHLAVYIENELVASSFGASKMLLLEQNAETGSVLRPPTGNPQGSPAGAGKFRMEIAPAGVEILPPGLTGKPFDPTHPTDAFPDFLKRILRNISSGLDMNYNAYANDAEGVSFSQGRLGIEDMRDTFRRLQSAWARGVLQPMYEAWLEASILKGKLKLGSYDWKRYRACSWRPRSWSYVDPLKDKQADALWLRLGLISPQRIADETGLDLEEIYEELKQANELAAKYGLPPNMWMSEKAPETAKPKKDETEVDESETDESEGKSARSARRNGNHHAAPRFTVPAGLGG